MNGVHDMGGQQGMGPVHYERNEPVFHAAWEGRVYALTRAMRAWDKWNLDASRYALEILPPLDYLRMSYYERWASRLVTDVVKYGFVTGEELESGKVAPGSPKAIPPFTLATSSRWLNRGIASSHDPKVEPSFTIGQRVRARNINPIGHTRLPRYARGRAGVVTRDHGVYLFPDTNAHFLGEKRQHVYSIRFMARELWGEAASPRDSVYLDMWDDYLEPA
ncbi:MAG TPA: nitrile hydratase subunit beta [Dehalococcoidia bacterium]|jgi:nitrile hydratase|nr:nitrile hydratase subunit beta [Dehalococcoidia bacterium]